MSQIRVDFVTNQAPHYRAALWAQLVGNNEIDAIFLFGDSTPGGIRTIDFSKAPWVAMRHRICMLRNCYIKEVLIWQRGVLTHIWRTNANAMVFLGDMNILSTWLSVWLARRRGISVLFWGHGMYGREGGVKRWLRTWFLRLADCNLVYGEHARGLLLENGFPPHRVRVVYNSLDHARQRAIRTSVIQPNFYSSQGWFDEPFAPILLFVGRLTSEKRLDSLINAVQMLREVGEVYNFILVGDGPEISRLKELAAGISGQVHFYGACYLEEELGRLIANADLCVSPGNVGLTAMHALGYGVPVCTHSDLTRQMPEAESIIEGRTGVLFNYFEMDLVEAIRRWFASAPSRDSVRKFCYKEIDDKWNTGNQAHIIVKAIKDFGS